MEQEIEEDGENSIGNIKAILQRISASTTIDIGAFWFVLHAIHRHPLSNELGEHTDAAEFCWRLHDLAILMYGPGPDAVKQLADWGVQTTEDFGTIVYSLISAGLMEKNEQDSIEDFQGIFEFENSFYTLQHTSASNRRMQWRLSTLFFITTISSIAFAGAAKLGFRGAIGTLFSSWLGFIGVFCIYLGIVDRSTGWLLSVFCGITLCAIGVLGFVVYTT